MEDFDIRELHRALDAERRVRGLTWAALAREITGPGPGAIVASSFSGMARRRAVNANVAMAALRWLDRTPESFVSDHPDAATCPPLPKHLPQRFFGRWKLQELHELLDTRRAEHNLTWASLAREVGVRPEVLASYARPDTFVSFPSIVRVTCWLERPLTDFVQT